MNRKIIFYDGVCALCNWFVLFVIKIDRSGIFYFVAQESSTAKEIAQQSNVSFTPGESIVLLDESRGVLYQKSDAVLFVFATIGGLWHLARLAHLVPKIVRDYIYDLIARNRYRIFGKYDTCPLPPSELRSRFL